MPGPFSEADMLATCALRIDGYTWAVNQGLEREDLMKAFWHDDIREQLFTESWDYQWAAWFMQQRSLAWSGSPLSGEILALWRRLFVNLATKTPSPPFDRGGPDPDSGFAQTWNHVYAPHAAALREAIRLSLERNTPIDELIRI